jgi:hypothetical protein
MTGAKVIRIIRVLIKLDRGSIKAEPVQFHEILAKFVGYLLDLIYLSMFDFCSCICLLIF